MDRIKAGFVGCGVGAAHHIPALKAVPHVDIVWFCDRDENQARKLMKLWGKNATINKNFEKLLNDSRPDVVHVCTPQVTHMDLTIKAFKAGCHVLLEKPMAMSVDECKRILAARDKSECQLCMMHNHIFDPVIQDMHYAIEQGVLGKLICGEARHFYTVQKMAEEGSLDPNHWVHSLKSGIAGEFIPHSMYLLQYFFGSCRELQLIHEEIDKDVQSGQMRKCWSIQLRFENAVGRILVTDFWPYGHFGIDLYGTLAAAHINMMDLTYSIERIHEFLPLTAARMESTVEQSFHKLWQILTNSARIATGQLKRRPGHRGLVRAFYDALRNGKPVPVSGEDGLAVVQTLEMLDKAMEEVRLSR